MEACLANKHIDKIKIFYSIILKKNCSLAYDDKMVVDAAKGIICLVIS